MRDVQARIFGHLEQVTRQRAQRAEQPELLAAVQALKLYQQRRFSLTYADLLQTRRYGAASQFFLEELYGPRDFGRRDAQFMRAVPAFVRLFPSELVQTVATLARLHSLSESLDSDMGRHLVGKALDAQAYAHAWRRTGRTSDRNAQIGLTLEVGAALDRYTRKPWLRQTLRVMRGPARSAGFGELQRFLEAGLNAFRAMNGADDFLRLIERRESELADALFATVSAATGAERDSATAFALAHLP